MSRLQGRGPGRARSRRGGRETRSGHLLSRRQTLLAFSGLTLGMFLAVLNQTIIATALPQIVSDLGGLGDFSWVITSYVLAMTVTAPIWGRLSDVHGRRPFFMAGIVIFLVGAVIGATAGSMGQLIAARTIQGLAAGALVPLALASIGDVVPASDRGRWQGMHGGVVGTAAIVGPATGGWIVDQADWRWIFLISLPLGLLALAVVAVTLRIPRVAGPVRSMDLPGAVLLGGALLGLMFGILDWGKSGRVVDLGTLGPLVVGLVLLAVLVVHERRVADPFLPIDLLRDAVVRRSGLVLFAVGVVMFGVTTFVPLFAQGALGASATQSGLVLMPLLVAMVVTSILTGAAIARVGRYRAVIFTGPPLMAAGFVVLTTLDERSAAVSLAGAMLLLGIGLGCVHQNLLLVMQNAVARMHLGVVTSGAQSCRTIGGVLGLSITGAIVSASLTTGPAASGVLGSDLDARAALADAIHPLFVAGVPLAVLTSWIALRIPERPLRGSVLDDHERTTGPAEAAA